MASRRNYLTEDELEQYADITVTNTSEMDDQISQAEEMIDAYVGPQDKFLSHIIEGMAQSGGTTSLVLDSKHIGSYTTVDFFNDCIVEIIGGNGSGERKRVTGSSTGGTLTTEAFTTAINSTSFYRIYQLGRFPRRQDVSYNSYETPNKYYKSIPEAVKRATASQLQFIIEMGSKYFSTDGAERQSESIGNYAYSKKTTGNSSPLIAPKAKLLLKGIVNRTGEIL